MRASLAVVSVLFALCQAPVGQASQLDQQEECLDSAMRRYADLKQAAIQTMQSEVTRCEVSGTDEVADRCYGIVGRKLANALSQAKVLFAAEQEACLH